MKLLIKQWIAYNSLSGLHVAFEDREVAAENDNQYVISEFGDFRIIQKPHAANGGTLLNEIYANEYYYSPEHQEIVVMRYKLDDDEHDFDFYEVASREFARFELTKDLWINRNGEIEPRRSEVTA